MANNISSMLQFWKGFNLPQLQRNLDVSATELAGRQDASDAGRKTLVEQSKEFKKATSEEVRKSVTPLLRSFQSEIDALSKRAKASEADYLNLYKRLVELPDPVLALEQAEHFHRKAQKLNDVETENQKLRETLAEYNKEFAEVKNQEVTIKNLREKVREYEKGMEDLAKHLTQEKNEELQKQFAEKETKLQETQLLIATKLGEAELKAGTYKAALDSSQAELFDLKSKYDEEIAAKQAELDLVLGDMDKMAQRMAASEKEIEMLEENISNQSNLTQGQSKPSTAMEEAFEVLTRSSLEAELTNKEKEISQLVEDVQHLQGSMGKLRESSSSAIAKLEEEVAEKNSICQHLQRQIDERQDYDEIKRELQIIKSTEFASFDSLPADQQTTSLTGSSKSKSLEMLLLEKNRSQQSENTALRAANAQLTGHVDRSPTSSPVRPRYSSERTHYRKEHPRPSSASHHSQTNLFSPRNKDFTSTSHRSQTDLFSPRNKDFTSTSHRSQTDLFSPRSDFSPILDPADALSQLQMQNQRQLNALLNFKILASIKAAVAAQNVSSATLLGGFATLPNQSPHSFQPTTARYDAVPSERPSSSNRLSSSRLPSSESQMLAKYIAQLQMAGNAASQKPVFLPNQELSDNSDSDENALFSQTVSRNHLLGNKSSSRHPSDPNTSSNPGRDSFESPFSRFRSHSLTAEKGAYEEVDTEDLTRQVKELLQDNNIGQRAFGQYVLGLSQGSVSEILSKPKPWSKLTFKGKEPFYKMTDFVSSPTNVDILKSLQRRDREKRVQCTGRTQALCNTDPASDQAIADILAAAREEMRVEQEKLKRAQEIYAFRKEIGETEKNTASRREAAENSSDQENQPSTSSCTKIMTTVASGHCTFTETSNIVTRLSEKMNPPITTNGATEPMTLDTSLPSLIRRQRAATGNENYRVLRQDSKDKHDIQSGNHSDGTQLSKVAVANDSVAKEGQEEDSPNCWKVKDVSRTSNSEKEGIEGQANFDTENAALVKTEPIDAVAGYFGDEDLQKDPKISFSVSKKDLLSVSQRLIDSHQENETYRRLFVTTSYNDPFIPRPPLSPAAEDAQNSTRSSSSRSSPSGENDQSYESPFIGDESVISSHYMNEDSLHPAGNSSQAKPYPNKRTLTLSTRDSSIILHDPALFKDLSCAPFDDREGENVQGTNIASSTTSTFSSMLSPGMSSLHPSSSLFDSHASYIELSPVTTGTLFTPQREPREHDLSGISSTFSSVEGSQNGISSMLPPLARSSHQHATSPVPTYSNLMNTVTCSKYSSLQDEHHDEDFDGDHLLEMSSIMTPIPAEALRKLSGSHIDTDILSKQVKDRLARLGICQRIFGERILGLSQGTVSDILSLPTPWSKLTHKGREPFARMIMWLADSTAGGLLPHHEGSRHSNPESIDNGNRSASESPNNVPVNLTKEQHKSRSPNFNGPGDSTTHFVALSSPSTNLAPSPLGLNHTQDRISPVSGSQSLHDPTDSNYTHLERHFRSNAPPQSQDPSGNGAPETPFQQMLNIQELSANCPKLDNFALTRKVKDLLTEHNIGQRIFGQAVLGLTQGSVSDLLSRPKLWRSLSLKGREPFVRMQLWLSDPNNIEQLKNLKLERWMEKKWGGKRQRNESSIHSLSPVKKQRIVLSSEEKEVLRRAYAVEPYPSQETVDLLATKLSRKSSTIVNWFHNYRSRVKRGFFPGEELVEAHSKKHGGSKMTVKQLLDGITLSNPPSNSNSQARRGMNPHRTFSSKNGHEESAMTSSVRRNVNRPTHEISHASWVLQHVTSPTNFDRYAAIDHHLKTESMDQHFQNLQRSNSGDMYANSVMHIKEEAKMLQLHSDTMFNPSYSYPMSSSIPELTLDDPVAMAAATSFIQPKPVHDSSGAHFSANAGPLYTNLDEPPQHHHHHEVSYASSLSNETVFISNTKLSVSPPSPHSNSMLPPVHTFTPKKSFCPSSNPNLMLPSASLLLNTPHLSPNMAQDIQIDPHMYVHNQRPTTMHHLVNLSRPRYDTVIAGNKNTNNNLQPNMVSNVTLPGGVSLSVTSTQRSPVQSEGGNKITTAVWVSSPNENTHGHLNSTDTSPTTSTVQTNFPGVTQTRFSKLDSIANEKDAEDGRIWVF